MLSEQIHRAMAQGYNRFEVCRMTARGVKVMHKPGERFEATIGLALTGLGDLRDGNEAAEGASKMRPCEEAPLSASTAPAVPAE